MFTKLRTNYKLSNVLVRVAFVLTYVLYSWQNILATTQIALSMYGSRLNLPDTYVFVVAIFTTGLIGVAWMFLVPLIVKFFLNFSNFYSVPRAEYTLIVHLFFTLYYLACGLLSIVHLFTPLLLTWGAELFPFVVGTGCVIGFYAVTSKLYFNDATVQYYFRNLAIVYFVFAFVFGVVL